MSHFYKCFYISPEGDICPTGTDSARQCGVNPCKHTVSFCEIHGGDAQAIDTIRKHMAQGHGRTDLYP